MQKIMLFLLCLTPWVIWADAKSDLKKVELRDWTWESTFQTDDLRLENGMLKATCLGFEPQISSSQINIDTSKYNAFEIVMSISDGAQGQIFWYPLSEKRSVKFALIPDGKFHTYTIPVEQNKTWQGMVTGLRFDPCSMPMTRFAIKSFRPIKRINTKIALDSAAPDELIMLKSAAYLFTGRLVNLGTETVSTNLQVDGRDVFPGETLLPNTAGNKIFYTIAATDIGSRELRFSAAGYEKIIQAASLDAVEKPLPSPSSWAVDFTVTSSDWTMPYEAISHSKNAIVIKAENRPTAWFNRPLTAVTGFVLKAFAKEPVQAVVNYRDTKGRRTAVLMPLPKGMQNTAIKLPETNPEIYLENVVFQGQGEVHLKSLHVEKLSLPPTYVALEGDRLFWNSNPHVKGYICEIRSPFAVLIRGDRSADFKIKLEPLELGEVGPVPGAIAMPRFEREGNGRINVMLDRKSDIGVYHLTVSSKSLKKEYQTRLYLIESQAELAKLREPLTQAIYGPAKGKGSKNIPAFDYGIKRAKLEKQGRVVLYESDLSPAWLLRLDAGRIALFDGLSELGLGQPTGFAVPTGQGIKVCWLPALKNAEMKTSFNHLPRQMSEPWMLFWFSGADGWRLWDVPILVNLQHRPSSIDFLPDKVELSFPGDCGYLSFLPLYGFYRPPQQGKEMLKIQGLPERGIATWRWRDGLPKEVAKLAKWWSRVLQKYPIYCDEKFNVDPGSGKITVSQKFDYLTIDTDWPQPAMTVAPLSPTLAFTQYRPERFPVKLSHPAKDPDMMTPYGPYLVVENTDRYEYEVTKLLDYINETEIQLAPENVSPGVTQASEILQKTCRERFKGGPQYMVEFDTKLFVWAQLADWCYPKGVTYADSLTQAKFKSACLNYYNTYFFGSALQQNAGTRGWWRPYATVSGKMDYTPQIRKWLNENTVCIDGPGIQGGLYGDSGKVSASAANNLWNYAHYTGDWEIVKRRWDFIRRCNTNSINMDWKAMGRNSNAEGGEHLPPAMALARLAYLAGDMDLYYFSAYCFMRETLMVFAKQRSVGTKYFRERQPYTDDTPMPYWALPSHTLGEAAGWMLDAKGYQPIHGPEIQSQNRWVRFSSEDCGRFYRENLVEEMAEEIAAMQQGDLVLHCKPTVEKSSAHAASQLRLMSYLQDASPEKIVAKYPPKTWNWQLANASGTVAQSHAFIRTAMPRKYNRLIPRTVPASGFVTGLQRQPVLAGWRGLLLFYSAKGEKGNWPQSRWYQRGGEKVLGDKQQRDFKLGRIKPASLDKPLSVSSEQLNWNTKITVFK